jgi:hypothetical protein
MDRFADASSTEGKSARRQVDEDISFGETSVFIRGIAPDTGSVLTLMQHPTCFFSVLLPEPRLGTGLD